MTADANIVDQIISHTPSIADSYWGDADLSSNLFDESGSHFRTSDGTMTWYGAQAWVNYLNAQNYAGYNDWRLPVVKPLNGTNFVVGNSSDDVLTLYNGNADVGWNNGHAQTELGHLLFGDLGITGSKDVLGHDTIPSWPNAGPFTNFGLTNFWTGTKLPDGLDGYAEDQAMFFFGNIGFQGGGEKPFFYFRAWAVRDGDSAVAAVPLPAGVWLLGTSLMGLLSFRRRQEV
ncbi:MAG TPA: VPLPA-CTERM sorting domain-containing protein [Methylococcaceae bacterium]|nr:VPLPA-CTERM sorting domain-containing protein [Methylococcaceae bacterium]